MNGYAEFLLVDWLAQLEPHWRLALFASTGVVAGLLLDVIVRRVPVAVEQAWLAEMQAVGDADTFPSEARARASAASIATTMAAAVAHAPPARRWQISILSAVLSVAVSWRFGPTWQSLGALGLVWTLIALAYIDYDTQLLPDILTLPLLWVGLLVNLGHWFSALPAAVIGAAVGYMSLWALYWVYWWIRRREGMGFGDFKLYAALGAWFGWTALVQILLLACLLAIVVAGTAWLAGRLRSDQMFPFGAFLATAGVATLFWGNGLTI
jgi:leader peptidase (prepilin peptidase)/N-methyltransferase